MKKAVAHLIPFMEEEKKRKLLEDPTATATAQHAGVVLLATVKGDVHDIGKNIVAVVLGCNNYKVVDLGVMTPCEKIIQAAIAEKADIIGLSGLITPSLDEMVFVASELQRLNFKVPLLIGGATTSQIHTAVKIAPRYQHPTVHVLDASRSVPVVSGLLDPKNNAALADEIASEYRELRENHYRTLKDRKYYSLEAARARAPKIDWSTVHPTKPSFIGARTFKDYPLDKVISRIDWNPFFAVWELRGKHPNRGYPKIFNDADVGAEAKKIFDEANAMIKDVIAKKLLTANAVIGFYPAHGVGDDIVMYEDESRTKVVGTLHGLRQQAEREQDTTCQAFGDFIAPKSSGVNDYVGLFALSAGFGAEELAEQYKKDHDDYHAILIKAVADRLAEALAEHMHEVVRKELWGYAREEQLSNDEMFRAAPKYQGVRPAPGYPSQPDHTEKNIIWELMNVKEETGIVLTDTLVMLPGAAVCGVYFANPHATYMNVDKITKEQVQDYAARKAMPVEEIERWLAQQLAYDRDAK